MKINSTIVFCLVIFIGIAVLLQPYLQVGIPDTHDGNNHLVRFASYKIAIKEGQFPPRWAPNLLDYYGYPVFNFNYPLANILSLPFSLLKVHYEATFKVLVLVFVLVGAAFLKKWFELISPTRNGSAVAVLAWLLMPFLASTVYFRGNIGEIAAYSLMPCLFYIAEYIHQRKVSLKRYALFSLIFAAFLLSHNITVVFSIPIIFLYAMVRYGKKWLEWRKFMLIFALGVSLSLWFWLPALAEMQFTNVTSTGLTKEYYLHFASVDQLLFSPLSFGYSVQGQVDGLSFNAGIVSIIVAITGLLVVIVNLILSRRLDTLRLLLAFASLTILVLLFLQTEQSLLLWKIVSFAELIQFPWRLSIFIGIFSALGAFILWQENNLVIKCLLLLGLLISVVSTLQAKELSIIHKDMNEYDAQTISTSSLEENRPKTFLYEIYRPREIGATVLQGDAVITPISWNGSKRQYLVSANIETTIVEPTADFIGWETTVKNEESSSKVAYTDDKVINGRIAYKVAPGSYEVTTQFTQHTWPRLLGNSVSVAALFLLVYLYLKKSTK